MKVVREKKWSVLVVNTGKIKGSSFEGSSWDDEVEKVIILDMILDKGQLRILILWEGIINDSRQCTA